MRLLRVCLAVTLVASLAGVGALPAAQEIGAAPAPVQEQGWTRANLLYGPIEIAGGIFAPLIGTLGGTVLGIVFPIKAMGTGSRVLIPYTAAGGMVVGTATGALVAPVLITEGVWDTLTFGAFSDRAFSWFKTNVQFEAHVEQGKISADTADNAD
jgi:hypothetical protein